MKHQTTTGGRAAGSQPLRARRVTLVDVAAKAGVSVSSASRALADQSASATTRERVWSAARDLGYVPDSTARSLKLGGTRQVIFAVDDIGNPNYVEMLRAIEKTFGHIGPRVSVTTIGRDTGTALDLVEAVRRGRADGLIICPIRRTPMLEKRLASSPIPTVVIGGVADDLEVDSVTISSTVAVRTATEHLIEQGRRTIAFINGPTDTNPGRARVLGFEQAMHAAGLGDDPSLTVSASDFTISAGVVAANALFDRLERSGRRIDAIVAANDLLAIATINVAQQRGIGVPGDIAVTGIDDTELASMFIPAITSVSLRSFERGRVAAELLEARFADPQRPFERVALEPSMTVRTSSEGGRS